MSKNFGSQILWTIGVGLTLLGVALVPVWLVTAGSWEGSVSWRKPILFGVSTGLTLCSLGWAFNALVQKTRFDHGVASVIAGSLGLEVLAITLQQMRGVPSHFNHATPFDALVDRAMLWLIVIAFAGILHQTYRVLTSDLKLTSDQKAALRWGMIYLVVSCLVGFVISFYGFHQIAQGLPPEKVGDEGIAKFPHGAVIHSLQLLPFFGWSLKQLSILESSRLSAVRWWIVAIGLMFLYSVIQTWMGRSRWSLTPNSIVLLISIVCFVVPIVILLFRRWKDSATAQASFSSPR